MEYNFNAIEKKWQQAWKDNGTYQVPNQSSKPKYYVLDMFPYPSGAGLHVGHPLGYIASDIFSRYKRLKGYNVLHPMGYDAFGLPAEQYAIEHGVHPAVSTAQNINNFRKQLDNIGFCYDWDREVRTCEPGYYKWTQWIFLQLFNSFFNRQTQKAEPISQLIACFEKEGNATHPFPNEKFSFASLANCPLPTGNSFSSADWNHFDEATRQTILMEYRLAYCGYGEVNWCEALGTVLANDEVVNGVSERGGHPVVKKKLRQWYLRITEYADRLLQGLETIDFSDAMKEMQTNWIGKSYGAEIVFPLAPASPRRGEEPTPVPGAGYAKYSVDSTASFENAKQMRKEPTEAEQVLWEALRNRNIGYKFRRQHPIEQYIADFACLDVWLLVEVDGKYHTTEEQQQQDAARDAFLKEVGFTTLRFTNDEVLHALEDVIGKIKATADGLKSSAVYQPAKSSSPSQGEAGVRVYTTRPDTIFGVDFMVIAPEHDLVKTITTPEQQAAVDAYVDYVNSRSDRERQAEKKITGCFTGAYAINPFSGREIPIWISEYVLAGYGTGAIMAVPCGDERDFKFAQHFGIPITNIIGEHFNGEEANATKDAVLSNSGFLDGTPMRQAAEIVMSKLEELGIGKRKVNYKMRDAAFSRQRYWGEPFPIQWKNGVATPLNETELPLLLPEVDSYSPGPEGEGPLANIPEWVARELETNTMPGYAGSSWYFLRYMDPHNNEAFCDRAVSDYWNQVDLYVGGTEHAVGHLLYSRMWTKALYDLGHIGFEEPFKKLLNQGMIQGISQIAYVRKGYLNENGNPSGASNTVLVPRFSNPASIGHDSKLHIYSADCVIPENLEHFAPINIPIDVTIQSEKLGFAKLKIEQGVFKYPHRLDAVFICEDAFWYKGDWYTWDKEQASWVVTEPRVFYTKSEVEKMSKSKYNVTNPDEIISKYGADTFRMYEMFLGPVEVSKPWDTKGIEGVHRFLKKLWRLYFDEAKGLQVTQDAPTADELKVLHKTIKKVEDDIERFSFNTVVSALMVCVNELTDLKCRKAAILEPLAILLAPYAPHLAEELYAALGHSGSVLDAAFPVFDAAHVVESTKEYPVSINGKLRTTLVLPADAEQPAAEAAAMANEVVQKWLEGKPVKKFIFVKGRMINVVV